MTATASPTPDPADPGRRKEDSSSQPSEPQDPTSPQAPLNRLDDAAQRAERGLRENFTELRRHFMRGVVHQAGRESLREFIEMLRDQFDN